MLDRMWFRIAGVLVNMVVVSSLLWECNTTRDGTDVTAVALQLIIVLVMHFIVVIGSLRYDDFLPIAGVSQSPEYHTAG